MSCRTYSQRFSKRQCLLAFGRNRYPVAAGVFVSHRHHESQCLQRGFQSSVEHEFAGHFHIAEIRITAVYLYTEIMLETGEYVIHRSPVQQYITIYPRGIFFGIDDFYIACPPFHIVFVFLGRLYHYAFFSADAFGKFGALDVDEPWTEEARRYYFNIVGKFGANVQSVLKKAGLTGEQVKAVIPHQANYRIINEARRRLPEIAPEKFLINIDRYGNTSSASEPILLDEVNRQGILQPGDYVVLSAFGGGLSSACSVVRWGK